MTGKTVQPDKPPLFDAINDDDDEGVLAHIFMVLGYPLATLLTGVGLLIGLLVWIGESLFSNKKNRRTD